MSQTLQERRDDIRPAAKDAVRTAMEALVEFVVASAVSRLEGVVERVESAAERSPAERSPAERSAAGRSPAGRSPAGRSPAGRSPEKAADSGTDRAGRAGRRRARPGSERQAPTPEEPEPEDFPEERHGGGPLRFLTRLLRRGFGLAARLVDRLADWVEDNVAGGGVKLAAGLRAVSAVIGGGNPIWAAIKGAFAAMSTGAKVALILGLVLAVILLPVAVLLLLIAAIVVILVVWGRTHSRQS